MAICLHCARSGGKGRREPVVLALLLILVLGLFSSPGMLTGLFLLVLGFQRRDWILIGYGVFFLPIFLVTFYYDLELDLACKSFVITGSGLCLLIGRGLLLSRPWAREAGP
jgi:uncharacterized membrane protein